MTRTRSIIAALLVVCAACKGDKKSDGSGGKKGGGCELDAGKTAEVVAGKTPQIIAPFAALKLGMSAADAKAACPNLWKDEESAVKAGTFSVGEMVGDIGKTGVFGRLNFTADKLSWVELDLPEDIAAALTAAWSAPKSSAGTPATLAWHDDATGIRAMLAPGNDGRRELDISSYVPLKAFVELDPGTIAFKAPDILGKTGKELIEKFPLYVKPEEVSEATRKQTEAMMADMKKEVEALGVDTSQKGVAVDIELPATPFAAGGTTSAIIHPNDDGTVRSYAVWFRTKNIGSDSAGWPEEITALVKTFDEVWGPSKKIKRTLGDELTWFDPKAGIRASAELDPAKPDELDVSYIRYQPLAAFFGQPGPVWGFEKPERPLYGATPDQLVAAYGTAIKLDPDGTSAVLTALPTDYDDDVSTTTILMFIRNGKVGQWNVRLDFEAYEPSKAEYQALLVAKLGEPKPGKFGAMNYGKAPVVAVKFSDITHEMQIEVGAD